MKFYTKIVIVKKFEELNIDAKNKAIEDHRQFLLAIMTPSDFISGCPEYDTPDELQKTYEAEYNYYLMNDEPVIENIELNDYDFDETGEIISQKELLSMTEM